MTKLDQTSLTVTVKIIILFFVILACLTEKTQITSSQLKLGKMMLGQSSTFVCVSVYVKEPDM